MSQFKPASASFLIQTLPPSCQDESQYWFARYELERRKPESRREANASLNISATDTEAEIALKLMSYGYRAAPRKYHPDHGGSSEVMKKLNAARDLARKHLIQK